MPSLTKGYWWVLVYGVYKKSHMDTISTEKGAKINQPLRETIVGFCGLKASSWHQKTGYLSRVGIHPLHQGRQLQRKLIRARERLCRRLLWSWVVTDTAPDNYASSNSLISLGYKLYEPWYKWAANKSSLYWHKKL